MFNFEDGHANRLEPFKRPRTTLVNYIVSKDGVPVMMTGCPGGDHQAQANLQLMLNSLLWGMNPQEAVEAPRFASQSVTNSFYPHTYYPGQLGVEPGISQSTRLRAVVDGPRYRNRRERRHGRDRIYKRPGDRGARVVRGPAARLLRDSLVSYTPAVDEMVS